MGSLCRFSLCAEVTRLTRYQQGVHWSCFPAHGRVCVQLCVPSGLAPLVTTGQVASHGTGFLQVKGKAARGYGTHDRGLTSMPF